MWLSGKKWKYGDLNEDSFPFTHPLNNLRYYAFLNASFVTSHKFLPYPVINAEMIGASANETYKALKLDKEINPIKIKAIRVIFDKAGFNANFCKNSPLLWYSKDANGQSVLMPNTPINSISINQFNERMFDLEYENLIVGMNQFFTWQIPKIVLNFTFIYDQFELSDLLFMRKHKSLYEQREIDQMEMLL